MMENCHIINKNHRKSSKIIEICLKIIESDHKNLRKSTEIVENGRK